MIPVAQAFDDYASDVERRLRASGVRVNADLSNETLKYKIRTAQTDKIPYMLIVGERERDTDSVSVRQRRGGDIGTETVNDFVQRIATEIAARTLDVESS